jgi:hypothetical protein
VFNPSTIGFYAEADALFWYANQEGMSFATKVSLTDNNTNTNFKENDLFFENKWDYGARGIVGYKPNECSWDVRLVYDYFSTKIHHKEVFGQAISIDSITTGSVVAPAYVEAVFPYQTSPAIQQTANYSLDPLWKLYFNSLDLEFAKEFDLSEDAMIRPHVGLKGLWMDQHFEEAIVVNSVVTSISNVITSNYSQLFTESNKFSGVGARGGLDIQYSIWGGLDLYGSFAAGLLWGWFNVNQQLNTLMTETSFSNEMNDETFKHSHHSTVFNLDVALGFCWKTLFNCNRNQFSIKFGWEQHLFTNINQFQNFIANRQNGILAPMGSIASRNVVRGNLTLSGFIVGAGVSF